MKKNFRKILALTMALCMVFSFAVFASAATNEATASGGTATSAVTLSSTDDGTLGGGAQQTTDTSDDAEQNLIDGALQGCYMTGVGDSSGNTISVNYNAIVTPVSEAVTNSSIASVLFIICWDVV